MRGTEGRAALGGWKGALEPFVERCGAFGALVLVLASGCKPLCRITCPGSSVLRTAQCRDSHVAVPNGHSCIPARVCLNTSRSTESVKKKKKNGEREKRGGGAG